MSISIVINQMIQLCLIILLGYLLFKVKIMDEAFNQKLTKLI
jgi:predicted permease